MELIAVTFAKAVAFISSPRAMLADVTFMFWNMEKSGDLN